MEKEKKIEQEQKHKDNQDNMGRWELSLLLTSLSIFLDSGRRSTDRSPFSSLTKWPTEPSFFTLRRLYRGLGTSARRASPGAAAAPRAVVDDDGTTVAAIAGRRSVVAAVRHVVGDAGHEEEQGHGSTDGGRGALTIRHCWHPHGHPRRGVARSRYIGGMGGSFEH